MERVHKLYHSDSVNSRKTMAAAAKNPKTT